MQNIPTKVDGVSTLPASEFNNMVNSLENAITDCGQTLSLADEHQLSKSMSIYAAGGDFYTDSGTANNYVLTAVGAKQTPIAYINGMRVRFKPGFANAAGASNVNVAGLGVKSIKDSAGTSDPGVGIIEAGKDVELIYDGTVFRLKIVTVSDATTSAKGIVQLADQAAMEAETTGRAVTANIAKYAPSAAKAWVNFKGTGTVTIRASYGVSSITDLGTGQYQVNWSTSFSSANYCVTYSGALGTTIGTSSTSMTAITEYTAALVKIGTYLTSSFGDHETVCVAAHGDL